MNRASRPRTTKAIPGPTRKCRLLPTPIGTVVLPSDPRAGPGPSGARGVGTRVLTSFECATGPAPLPAGNRPSLRWHAVPFIPEGARPPLGHAHLRRSLLAGRVQRPL